MVKLFTDRLIIRDYVIEDLEPLHKLLSDNKVMKNVGLKTKNIKESKEYLLQAINESLLDDRVIYAFVIENKFTNEFIGQIDYIVIGATFFEERIHDYISEPNSPKWVWVRYFINKKHWNKGYATEALKRLIEYAFTEDNVDKIRTSCNKKNCASEKVMIKSGFIKEKEETIAIYAYEKLLKLTYLPKKLMIRCGFFKIDEFDAKWDHFQKKEDHVEYGLLKCEWKK